MWGEAEFRRLHQVTLELLADTGVDVRHEPALELFRAAGASVDGRRVRVPARLVDDALAAAPREWTLRPRGVDTEPLILRDGEVYYGTGSDVLYMRDPESGERRRVHRANVRAWPRCPRSCPTWTSFCRWACRGCRAGIDDLIEVVASRPGTRKPAPRAERRLLLARTAGDGGAVRREGQLRRHAMPSPPLMQTRTRSPRSSAVRPAHPPGVRTSANVGATGPRSIAGAVLVGNAETPRRSSCCAGACAEGRRSSTAWAPAPWTCAP